MDPLRGKIQLFLSFSNPGFNAKLGWTITVRSSLVEYSPSLAVKRNTYVPVEERFAVVEVRLALPNVIVPGPLTLVQVVVSAGGVGKPSSITVPTSVACDGHTMT